MCDDFEAVIVCECVLCCSLCLFNHLGTGSNACYIEKLERVEMAEGNEPGPPEVRKFLVFNLLNCTFFLLFYLHCMKYFTV